MRVYLPVFLALIAAPAFADTIVENDSIDFGTFAMRDTAQEYVLTVSPTGNVTKSAEILPITPARSGSYDLVEFPVDTMLNLSIADVTLMPETGTGPSLRVTDFTFTNANPMTGETGRVSGIGMGATLRTSPGGVYTDSRFTGTVMLVVDY